MRLGRRTLITLALASAAVALAACKKPGGSEAGPAGSGSEAPAGDIVIGHYASLTGGTAHFGQDTDKAAKLAVEQANAHGGVLGRKVRLVTLDTRGENAEGANAVSRLIDVEKVDALIGEVASSISLAGGRVAQRRGIPMVSPSSTNP